jgi:hypothetical protein
MVPTSSFYIIEDVQFPDLHFKGDRIVEYWDITQQVQTNRPTCAIEVKPFLNKGEMTISELDEQKKELDVELTRLKYFVVT